MNTIFFIGIVGMLFILIAFILELFRKLHREHIVYVFMNLIGSGAMTYYAYSINSIPFIILNSVWVLVSIYGIVKELSKDKK